MVLFLICTVYVNIFTGMENYTPEFKMPALRITQTPLLFSGGQLSVFLLRLIRENQILICTLIFFSSKVLLGYWHSPFTYRPWNVDYVQREQISAQQGHLGVGLALQLLTLRPSPDFLPFWLRFLLCLVEDAANMFVCFSDYSGSICSSNKGYRKTSNVAPTPTKFQSSLRRPPALSPGHSDRGA